MMRLTKSDRAKSRTHVQKLHIRLSAWTTLLNKEKSEVAKHGEAVNGGGAREESYHIFFGEVSPAQETR